MHSNTESSCVEDLREFEASFSPPLLLINLQTFKFHLRDKSAEQAGGAETPGPPAPLTAGQGCLPAASLCMTSMCTASCAAGQHIWQAGAAMWAKEFLLKATLGWACKRPVPFETANVHDQISVG